MLAGNSSWLLELNTTSVPPSLTVPPPGAEGGPPAAPLLLLYRRDWWERLAAEAGAASAPLPPTWPLLAGLLSSLLNKDLDGDGRADHVLCADLMPGCKGGAVLAAIWASLAQTQGTSQGLWFNATDLSPALDGPALPAALRLYAALAASNAAPFTPGGPGVSGSRVGTAPEELLAAGGAVDASGAPLCGAVNPLFASGRCLFTIDWAPAALRLTKEGAANISGHVAAALLPGSAMVQYLDSYGSPAGSSLVGCSYAVCPQGEPAPEGAAQLVEAVAKRAVNAFLSRRTLNEDSGLVPEAEAPELVNRAPFVGEAAAAWSLTTGLLKPTLLRTQDFLSMLDFELDMKYAVLLATGSGGSGATLDSGGMSALGLTEEEAADLLGMSPADMAAVAEAVRAAVAHPNAAMDIQIPPSASYRRVLDDLALAALQSPPRGFADGAAVLWANASQAAAAAGGALTPEQQVALTNASRAMAAITAAFPYTGILQHLYWVSIGYLTPNRTEEPVLPGTDPSLNPSPSASPEPATTDTDTASSDRSTAATVGIAVGVSVGAALLLALLGLAYYRRKRTPAKMKRVQPPGAGPMTTLVMTDVQNSTLLWEVLSQDIMDHCVHLHHMIMREAIAANRGYEVCTEGDAFAVAFYGPDDALGFATQVQEGLLKADWPHELLEQPDGCEVFARRALPHYATSFRPSTDAGMAMPMLPVLLEGHEPSSTGTNSRDGGTPNTAAAEAAVLGGQLSALGSVGFGGYFGSVSSATGSAAGAPHVNNQQEISPPPPPPSDPPSSALAPKPSFSALPPPASSSPPLAVPEPEPEAEPASPSPLSPRATLGQEIPVELSLDGSPAALSRFAVADAGSEVCGPSESEDGRGGYKGSEGGTQDGDQRSTAPQLAALNSGALAIEGDMSSAPGSPRHKPLPPQPKPPSSGPLPRPPPRPLALSTAGSVGARSVRGSRRLTIRPVVVSVDSHANSTRSLKVDTGPSSRTSPATPPPPLSTRARPALELPAPSGDRTSAGSQGRTSKHSGSGGGGMSRQGSEGANGGRRHSDSGDARSPGGASAAGPGAGPSRARMTRFGSTVMGAALAIQLPPPRTEEPPDEEEDDGEGEWRTMVNWNTELPVLPLTTSGLHRSTPFARGYSEDAFGNPVEEDGDPPLRGPQLTTRASRRRRGGPAPWNMGPEAQGGHQGGGLGGTVNNLRKSMPRLFGKSVAVPAPSADPSPAFLNLATSEPTPHPSGTHATGIPAAYRASTSQLPLPGQTSAPPLVSARSRFGLAASVVVAAGAFGSVGRAAAAAAAAANGPPSEPQAAAAPPPDIERQSDTRPGDRGSEGPQSVRSSLPRFIGSVAKSLNVVRKFSAASQASGGSGAGGGARGSSQRPSETGSVVSAGAVSPPRLSTPGDGEPERASCPPLALQALEPPALPLSAPAYAMLAPPPPIVLPSGCAGYPAVNGGPYPPMAAAFPSNGTGQYPSIGAAPFSAISPMDAAYGGRTTNGPRVSNGGQTMSSPGYPPSDISQPLFGAYGRQTMDSRFSLPRAPTQTRGSTMGARGSRAQPVGPFTEMWRDINSASAGDGLDDPPAGGGGVLIGGLSMVQVVSRTTKSILSQLYERLTPEDAVAMVMGYNPIARIDSRGKNTSARSAASALEPIRVFRGLRVRIGLHSGARENEVIEMVRDGVPHSSYLGDFLAVCKEVSDCAMGGVVVLSGAAFRAYQQQLRLKVAAGRDVLLLHIGEHQIKPPDPEAVNGLNAKAAAGQTREIFAAVAPPFIARLALLPSPVRTHQEVVPGCLSAPAGMVAPVFCNVTGVETLLAWEAVVRERLMRAAAQAAAKQSAVHFAPYRQFTKDFTQTAGNGGGGNDVTTVTDSSVGMVQAALALFSDLAQRTAAQHGGYVVASSSDGGHWVLVFGSAEQAVLWGLEMLDAMLVADWPDGFLEHELTEEVWEGGVLQERGLRLRIGIDYGRAMVRLVPRTGRLDYVGRPMNRAARIAAKAKAATVLASGAAWEAARRTLKARVLATNLGSMALKGVKEQLDLWALAKDYHAM
ncbi:hypothetical protein HYH03_007453 [Edaphochlamys debaryana]|uniref:Guanylate cyclase domain-containing protein n=1 Tax=Edaphochlamys debaryana TaxID=47281 RepID=A0A835Y1V8_9CHLO|nr:hypothetical protein HYH03_007453 [Edaphochlamys debaryana]|eukprot:KAG2494401.1 hypothetical protein HYH03_007453 [Edaphochlamys debaryana]